MDILTQIAIRIIKEQELITGPLAWREARKIPGLSIDGVKNVTVKNREAIDALVAHYELLFGKASHDVCKHAVIGIISTLRPMEIPLSLR